MERPIPTKTGVQIGLLHVNRTSLRPIEDVDMLRLQTALIKTDANEFYKKHAKSYLRAGRVAIVMLLASIFVAKFALAKVVL